MAPAHYRASRLSRPIAAFAAAIGAAGLLGCRKPLPPPRAQAPRGDALNADALSVHEVLTPGRVAVRLACTPSGPELCFDATDNNCNGIIDEGCGVQTGPLQFAIAWTEGPDVDLDVIDPGAELAKVGERTTLGLVKDRDCGRSQSACHGQNTENVFFAGERPPPGKYRVRIKLDNAEGVHLPLTVRFGGRLGIQTFSLDLQIASADDEKQFVFIVE